MPRYESEGRSSGLEVVCVSFFIFKLLVCLIQEAVTRLYDMIWFVIVLN